MMNTLSIVGVGLIGGSLGLAVKKSGLAREVIGVGWREESLKKALERGAVDRITTDLVQGVNSAELVVIATPVGKIIDVGKECLLHMRKDSVLTDVGSTKKTIVEELEKSLPPAVGFIGGHPLAGSEKRGVESAHSELFQNTVCILTPTERTSDFALKKVKTLWEGLGARIEMLSPHQHDRILAYTSHLPHLIAVALVNTLGEEDEKKGDFLSFVASGFRDTTRIASSTPSLWLDIFLANKKGILEGIEKFREIVKRMEKAIKKENRNILLKELERARELRDKLDN